MIGLIHDIQTALSVVFRQSRFVLYGLLSAFAAWILITVIMQFRFWGQILSIPELPLSTQLEIILTSFGIWGSGFTAKTFVAALSIILLTGVNSSLFIYFLQHRIQILRASSLGWWGMTLSLFGVGCASCGSALLTALIGFGAATTVVAALPFHGSEFLVFGILSILISIVLFARKIANPDVCRDASNS